ncbi:MAG: DUF4846 domain-containing protein [Fibrobacteria bacterium]
MKIRFARMLMLTVIGFLVPALSSPDTLTVARSIPIPEGYQRKQYAEGTFSRFVQTLPVKKDLRITAYNGDLIKGFNVLAVLDLPLLFKQDLEQCADFAMRLWAEYHLRSNTLKSLYLFDYNGKKKSFSAGGKSYSSFLKSSFSNSNSYSLKRGSQPVASEADLVPGDMLIQNEDGGIGHVSVILDIGEAPGKPRLYLVGFSYMPAQEFHIEKASVIQGKGGWFTYKGYLAYLDEILPYGPPVLRRFAP